LFPGSASFKPFSVHLITLNEMEKPICIDVTTKPEYFGKNFRVIKESKGSPKPENQSVVVKEASWHDGDCRLTIWFKTESPVA
jgi:hypothetical protein